MGKFTPMGKNVTVIEPNTRLLANLIPEFIALPIERQLKQQGIQLGLETSVVAIDRSESGLTATLRCGRTVETDIVISAAGLCANTQLAKEAAIRVNKGIVVDSRLQTSTRNVFALGDCAEIQDRMMPPMMVKVKTPSYPIQLAGTVNEVDHWEVNISVSGVVAKAKDDNDTNK